MEKLNCHSGTRKEEIIAFVNANIGKKIEVHFEENIIDTWGDDNILIYDTSIYERLSELLKLINDHYIHGRKVDLLKELSK